MNINLRETTFGGQISFLDSQQVRYIRGGITLDASKVTANETTGIKKLLAGSFVGKNGVSGKYEQYDGGVKASLITALAGDNNDLKWEWNEPGTHGNDISVKYTDPSANDQALSITFDGRVIDVSLATGAAGAITTTAAEIKAAIAKHDLLKDKVTVTDAADNNGTGVVTALAAASLADGEAFNVIPTLLLADDVTFTTFTSTGGAAHADQVVTAIDQARVIVARLPGAPDIVVKANVPGITWVE